MSILNEAVDMAYLKKHTIAFMRKISKDFELEVNLYSYKYAIGAGLNPRLHNVPLGSVLDSMRREFVTKSGRNWFIGGLRVFYFSGRGKKALRVEDLTKDYIGICLDPEHLEITKIGYSAVMIPLDDENKTANISLSTSMDRAFNPFKLGASLHPQYSRYKHKIPLLLIHKKNGSVKQTRMNHKTEKFKTPLEVVSDVSNHNSYNNISGMIPDDDALHSVLAVMDDKVALTKPFPDFVERAIEESIVFSRNDGWSR